MTLEGRNHTHVSSEISYGLIHPAIWSGEREGRELSKKKSKKTGHMVGQSDRTKRERARVGGGERGEGGGVDGCRFPPSFLPSSPQPATGVFPPPPLSHCQKPKPQLQKEFFSPLLPDCHMEKPFPGFMRTCCRRSRSGFDIQGSNGISALKFACIDCHGRKGDEMKCHILLRERRGKTDGRRKTVGSSKSRAMTKRNAGFRQ